MTLYNLIMEFGVDRLDCYSSTQKRLIKEAIDAMAELAEKEPSKLIEIADECGFIAENIPVPVGSVIRKNLENGISFYEDWKDVLKKYSEEFKKFYRTKTNPQEISALNVQILQYFPILYEMLPAGISPACIDRNYANEKIREKGLYLFKIKLYSYHSIFSLLKPRPNIFVRMLMRLTNSFIDSYVNGHVNAMESSLGLGPIIKEFQEIVDSVYKKAE